MAKVYRRTYGVNKNSLPQTGVEEPIPPLFTNVFYKDVTHEYLNTSDIEISLVKKPDEPRKIAYLCVFDNQNWVPVDWERRKGNKVTFRNVGPDIICMAGYWIDDEIFPASKPFRVSINGEITYLEPHPAHTVDLHLTRKYPLAQKVVDNAGRAIGAVIEASNDPEFSEVDTLHVIHRNNWGYFAVVDVDTDKQYQYVRMKRGGESTIPVAEFQIYGDGSGKPLEGEIISSGRVDKNALRKRYISDSDLLTSMSVRNWTGYDFGKPVSVTSIHFVTANDDNIVNRGEAYELFYWDGIDTVSLGRQVAKDYFLHYTDVPEGALYLLRNRTKGSQERIFTYEHDRIIFW